ncbi:MAG TPA: hypothetical protein PK191_07325 [Niabella sp.]|nr:hypothetical protein [Niabella sp.]HOZ96813.1 hypothetical protein [Niabella sp.]HQW14710.1 hypothetical protein [Niabella sp.]HQX20038.1 hypothetical protein [Niabella sp.]HQX40658.1 hypothetical protein [Niabella sp.]
MEKEEYSIKIYKPLMAGLFAGYFATIVNLLFDVVFRESTTFPLHELINVSTIIFATLILLALAGCVYAIFEKVMGKKPIGYIVFSLAFTLFLIYGTLQLHRSMDVTVNHEFQYLLIGIIAITGLFSTFFIPYFVKHSHLFM